MNNQGTRWIVIVIVVVLLLLCVCTCCIGSTGLLAYLVDNAELPDIDNPPVSIFETPSPTPPLVNEPPAAEADETLQALAEAEIPGADLHELGTRFLGVPADTPHVASTTNPDYPVGALRRFSVSNVDTNEQFEITAELLYKATHVYMWVEEGVRIDEDALQEAAELFDTHTYPTDREFFGSEWLPGVDGDPHLSILHARNLGDTVAGYFSNPDEYVKAVRADSNEMEMFYINIDNVTIGNDFYNGVLAHEFQHMIHWNNDRNETTWLNEGCSELAMALNDRTYEAGYYDVGGSDISYSYHTDTQLNSWPEGTAGSAAANYGAAYLFMEYFLDRFGEDATQALVFHPENSLESVDAVLQEDLGLSLTHEALFADWTIANLLDNPTLDAGEYGYREIDPYAPKMDISYTSGDYPLERTSAVHQYGADYVELHSTQPLHFSFTGSTQAKLMDMEAHSGQYLWWSNRTDDSDTMLTRRVDLNGATEAQLNFWAWYHIEEDWDYGYVVVGATASGTIPDDLDSSDIHWEILADSSLGCIATNPNGNSYGCGFTGSSNGWQQLSADLSPYAGQEIALRFEYITDAAVNQPGFVVDDVKVTADGVVILSDDMEEGDGDWIPAGFVRHANILPQEWLVQLVTYGPGEPEITRLLLTDDTQGEWTIDLGQDRDRAVIIISAFAPVTTELATYQFSLAPEE
jgi:hypothetical protein